MNRSDRRTNLLAHRADPRPGATPRRRAPWLAALLVAALAGCGSEITTNQNFRERVVGVDGQEIWLEDIREINEDADLDDDAKRQAFRDLGVVDADLIEALLLIQ